MIHKVPKKVKQYITDQICDDWFHDHARMLKIHTPPNIDAWNKLTLHQKARIYLSFVK